MQEPFLFADKFMDNNQDIAYNYETNESMTSLCLFNQNNNEFCEERLTVLEQQIIYGKLHGMYKKALNKALQTSSKSNQLINLLQEFAEEDDDEYQSDSNELNQVNNTNDKENTNPIELIL